MDQIIISLISLGSLGLLFGVVLSILDTRLKVQEDPLVGEVLKILPGINCGACGFSGCKAFAEAVVKQRSLFNGCLPGGEETNSKLAEVVGLDKLGATTALKVVVLCGAQSSEKRSSSEYKGPKTCGLADISLANIDCKYGCMGFGDCVEVCPTQALKIENGLVVVDYARCIGCGKCVEACPRNILQLVEASGKELYLVSCSNPENGPSTKKVCSRGCIGCGICAKVIQDSCFYLEGSLAKIDHKKAKDKKKEELGLARDKCPVKIISKFDV